MKIALTGLYVDDQRAALAFYTGGEALDAHAGVPAVRPGPPRIVHRMD